MVESEEIIVANVDAKIGLEELHTSTDLPTNGPSQSDVAVPDLPTTANHDHMKASDTESIESIGEVVSSAFASASPRIRLAKLTCEQCINLLYAIGCKSIEDIFAKRHITGEDLCYVESIEELKEFGLPLISIQLRKFYTKLCEWKDEGVPEDLLQTQYVQEVIIANPPTKPIVATMESEAKEGTVTKSVVAIMGSEAKEDSEEASTAMDVSLPEVIYDHSSEGAVEESKPSNEKPKLDDVAKPSPAEPSTERVPSLMQADAKPVDKAKPLRKKEKSAKEIQAEKQAMAMAEKSASAPSRTPTHIPPPVVAPKPPVVVAKAETNPVGVKRSSRASEVFEIVDDNNDDDEVVYSHTKKQQSRRKSRSAFYDSENDEGDNDDEAVRRSRRSSARNKSFVDLYDLENAPMEGIDSDEDVARMKRSQERSRSSRNASARNSSSRAAESKNVYLKQLKDTDDEDNDNKDDAEEKEEEDGDEEEVRPVAKKARRNSNPKPAALASTHHSNGGAEIDLSTPMQVLNVLKIIPNMQRSNAEAHLRSILQVQQQAKFNATVASTATMAANLVRLLRLYAEQDSSALLGLVLQVLLALFGSSAEQDRDVYGKERRHALNEFVEQDGYKVLGNVFQLHATRHNAHIVSYCWQLIQHGSEKPSFRKQLEVKTMAGYLQDSLTSFHDNNSNSSSSDASSAAVVFSAAAYTLLAYLQHCPAAEYKALQKSSLFVQFLGICITKYATEEALILPCCLLITRICVHSEDVIRDAVCLLLLKEYKTFFVQLKVCLQQCYAKNYVLSLEIVRVTTQLLFLEESLLPFVQSKISQGILLCLRQYCGAVDMVLEVCRAVVNASCDSVGQEHFAAHHSSSASNNSNCAELFTLALRTHVNKVHVVDEICRAITNLALHERIQAMFQQAGACEVLVKVLKRYSGAQASVEDKKTLEQICRSLTNMTVLPVNKQVFTELKLIPVLLEVMSKLKVSAVHGGIFRRILLSLNNMASMSADQALQILSYPQSVAMFVQLCSTFHKQEDMVVEICALLAALLINHHHNQAVQAVAAVTAWKRKLDNNRSNNVGEDATEEAQAAANTANNTTSRLVRRNRGRNSKFEDFQDDEANNNNNNNSSKAVNGSVEDSFAQRFAHQGGLSLMFKFAKEYMEDVAMAKDIACVLSALITRTAGLAGNAVQMEKKQLVGGNEDNTLSLSASQITTMINLMQLHIQEADIVGDVLSALTALVQDELSATDGDSQRKLYADMLFAAGICEVVMEVLLTYDRNNNDAAKAVKDEEEEDHNQEEEEVSLELANVLDVIPAFLMQFCSVHKVGRTTFLSFSVLDLFVKYMQQYLQDAEMLTLLCGSLQVLVMDDLEGKRKLVHQLDATDLLLHVIRAHANQVNLLHVAVDLLLELMAVPTVVQVLQHANSCKIMLQVMQVHVLTWSKKPSVVVLMEKICQLLYDVTSTDVTCMATLVDLKVLDVLAELLQKLPMGSDAVAMVVMLLHLLVSKLASVKVHLRQQGAVVSALQHMANSSAGELEVSLNTRTMCGEVLSHLQLEA